MQDEMTGKVWRALTSPAAIGKFTEGGNCMNIYKIKCVDYGWTAKIKTEKHYTIGDLCICRGCICAVVEICEEAEK